MYVEFNPVSEGFKSPVGGISVNKTVRFTVFSDASEITLLIRKDGGEYCGFSAIKAENRFDMEFLPVDTGLYFYRFSASGVIFGMPRGGYAAENFSSAETDGGEYSLTVFKEDFSTPEWIKGGVIYQIFPDRFSREGNTLPRPCQNLRSDWGGAPGYLPVNGKVLNDDFFGGNFRGIISRLDYLGYLGVTAIYLNPVFEARSNHRYDTGDYMKPDGLLGTESDLAELFSEAKKLGMGVILDGVFNHTGDDSVYFNKYKNYDSTGAYNSKDSPYSDWYFFNSFPDGYESWWGVDILPETNEASPSFNEFICGENGVLDHYLKMGAKGWRLDVADELPAPFVRNIRKAVKKHGTEAFIGGEVWENVTDKISYGVRREYFCGEELDSAMNYPLKNAVINFLLTETTDEIVSVINGQIDRYPAQALNCIMNILGTHDTPRILNVLSGKRMPASRAEQAADELTAEEYARGESLLKIAAALEYTLYGVPTLYYGDETGATGWADPFNRGCMDWNKTSFLTEYYAKLGAVRRENPVFKKGGTKIFYRAKRAFGFLREGEGERIYVAVNLGPSTPVFTFTNEVTDLLTGRTGREFSAPYGMALILKENI
ncbi:MAG: glycoside hydrolase family 13 protein [Clostridia bacterium]|nr:glycoside hydrolase family 13 protein [Clostridia bacterium]